MKKRFKNDKAHPGHAVVYGWSGQTTPLIILSLIYVAAKGRLTLPKR